MLTSASCTEPVAPVDPDLAVITPGDTLFSALVSGGQSSCALTIGGRAFCWGDNLYGLLGSRSIDCPGEVAFTYCEIRPIPAAPGLRFSRLAMSSTVACGITPSQRLYCWGDTPGGFEEPRGGALRFTDVSVRNYAVCALATDGQTYCWGDNYTGRLGIPQGLVQSLDQPRPVVGEQRFSTIQVTDGPVCATTISGSLFCWGGFADTTRFDGTGVEFDRCSSSPHFPDSPCSNVPLRWRGNERWARYASAGMTCGITTDGATRCWGAPVRNWGSAAFGRSEPADVLAAAPEAQSLLLPTPIRDIVAVTLGACAHAVDGRILCWGTDVRGKFGTGSQNQSFAVPTIVAGGRTFAQVSAGDLFMCGLAAAGDIWCWGDGGHGALGTGAVIPMDMNGVRVIATPTRIASIAGK